MNNQRRKNFNKQLPVIPNSPLPPLYAAWMDDLFAAPIPSESDATCDDCAMCAGSDEEKAASTTFFDPHVKCCSYLPELPNYLVGRVLADGRATSNVGRSSMAKRLEAGVAVTPLGIGQPRAFAFIYERAGASAFGQSRTLICPHFVDEGGGRCGIWEHRGVVCATWFCKFVRGAKGRDFWAALKRLLSSVERSLSYWCVLQVGLGSETLRQVFSPPVPVDGRALDGIMDSETYGALWGTWLGREAEFYQECSRLVAGLRWQDVLAAGGSEVQLFARLARDAYLKLTSDEIPARLKVGTFQIVRMDQDSRRVVSYSGMDPLDLPKVLVDVLPYFDGRPTNQAITDVAASEGVNLHPDLVRKLSDFEVLVPYDGSTPETTQQTLSCFPFRKSNSSGC